MKIKNLSLKPIYEHYNVFCIQIVTNWDDMEKIWPHTPEEHNVLLTEALK